MRKITRLGGETPRKEPLKRLRVAAYCRVSTDSDAQLDSLSAQKQHYESYIASRADWELAGLYYDEGLSGTKKDQRPELLRLIADCESGRIDLIITKSISRLARNTVDCLGMVRKLLELDIPIYFEKENLNTQSMESELFLSILSSMAEGESTSISQNSKWSIQRRYQNGSFKIAYPPYGYDWDGTQMVINPAQAEIVREVYEQVLAGTGTQAIANDLNRRQIPTKRGGKWSAGTIRGMVANEKYTGDVIFQKSYSDERFNRHINRGERDQYVMTDHHEAIISHETYEATQAIIAQRAAEKGVQPGSDKYKNRYCLSGRIICGECGNTLRRRMHTCTEIHYPAWCCNTHLRDKDACSMRYIEDAALKAAYATMMNKLIYASRIILRPYVDALRSGSKDESIRRLRELQTLQLQNADQRKTLTSLLGQGYLDAVVYNEEHSALLRQADEYRAEMERLNARMSGEAAQLQAARALLHLVENHEPLTAFDEELYTQTVDRAVILSRTEVRFELLCGLHFIERM